jgi:hypothetical protein
MQSISKFLLNLLLFVARLSQATRQAKILILFGTGAFQITFHKSRVPSSLELELGFDIWLYFRKYANL